MLKISPNIGAISIIYRYIVINFSISLRAQIATQDHLELGDEFRSEHFLELVRLMYTQITEIYSLDVLRVLFGYAARLRAQQLISLLRRQIEDMEIEAFAPLELE